LLLSSKSRQRPNRPSRRVALLSSVGRPVRQLELSRVGSSQHFQDHHHRRRDHHPLYFTAKCLQLEHLSQTSQEYWFGRNCRRTSKQSSQVSDQSLLGSSERVYQTCLVTIARQFVFASIAKRVQRLS
jgi:hypothetical protein